MQMPQIIIITTNHSRHWREICRLALHHYGSKI